jgi:ligand-binding sensor domain-containing protein
MVAHPRNLSVSLFLITIICLTNVSFSAAQSFRFKTFDSNVGLPQNFVYALAQDKDGYLWMGTGEGLVRYNGLKFENFNHTDSLANDFVTSLHYTNNGDLWIGHNNGDLTLFREGNFIPLRIAETKSPINEIQTFNEEYIWAISQNTGVIRINKNSLDYTILNHSQLNHKLFYSLAIKQEQILAGTSAGLFLFSTSKQDTITQVEHISQIPSTNITSIIPRKGIIGDFWIGTEDNGFFVYSTSEKESQHIVDNSLCLKFNIEWENIQDIEEEPNGNLLLATWGDGVIKLFYDANEQEYVDSYNFTIENGLNDNFVKDILCDRESNYWFATYGGGASVLTNEHSVFYNLQSIGFEKNKVLSAFRRDSTLWLGLETGLIKTDPFCFSDFEYYDTRFGIPDDEITGFYQYKDERLFISTGNNGLFYKDPDAMNFNPWHYTDELPGLKIRDIDGQDNFIYLATYGGFFKIDINSSEVTHLTTSKGLPHNNINFIFIDNRENLWIGPKNSGICKIDNGHIEVHKISEVPVDVYDMIQSSTDRFWLATHGRGIIKYAEDTIQTFNVNNGLSKNFCYSIEPDKNERLWVAHHPGLSAIDIVSEKIQTYNHEDNLGSDFHQIWKDNDNTLWFSGDQGVVHYFPEKHQLNEVPPALNFTDIRISGETYNAHQQIKLPYPYGNNYQFRFSFIGISFKKPEKVTYQYQLIKSDDDVSPQWIDLGNTRFREYDFLPSGSYSLKVRAFNADGVPSDPIAVEFTIATPFWKKAWFYIVLMAAIIYSVYLIIIFREKNLKKQKEALQKEVNIQTVQLREQKAEIERKNQDITDSINYAKTIQSSILPPLDVLKITSPSHLFFLHHVIS